MAQKNELFIGSSLIYFEYLGNVISHRSHRHILISSRILNMCQLHEQIDRHSFTRLLFDPSIKDFNP